MTTQRKTKSTAIIILSTLLLCGCDNLVSNFVDSSIREESSTSQPSTSSSSPMNFKVTPGKLYSTTSNNGAIQATITPTKRVISLGSDMAMSISINQGRGN